MNILITGASGKLGRMVVEQLLKTVAPHEIGLSVRDPSKVQDFASLGIRVRQGDFEDAQSLDRSFEGASQILIVSPNVIGDAAIKQHRTAIDAAKRSGAGRILYTSHMGSSAGSLFPPMVSHAAAEKYLEASGVPFTSFRNGFYSESATMMLGEAIKTGQLKVPEDGPVAWTSHADLAEATAKVLANGKIAGLSPSLTGSEAIDFEEIATILSELTGREIRRVVVTDEEYEASMIARGFPKERIPIVMGIFRASRRGEFSRVEPYLAQLIGRKPMTMRKVLKSVLPQKSLR